MVGRFFMVFFFIPLTETSLRVLRTRMAISVSWAKFGTWKTLLKLSADAFLIFLTTLLESFSEEKHGSTTFSA